MDMVKKTKEKQTKRKPASPKIEKPKKVEKPPKPIPIETVIRRATMFNKMFAAWDVSYGSVDDRLVQCKWFLMKQNPDMPEKSVDNWLAVFKRDYIQQK
jgi:hypothetical protein